MKHDTNTQFFEELKDAANDAEKQMLLQKYGMIAPKLTPEERLLIAYTEKLAEIEPYLKDWRPVDMVFEAPIGTLWESKL